MEAVEFTDNILPSSNMDEMTVKQVWFDNKYLKLYVQVLCKWGCQWIDLETGNFLRF